MNMKESDPPIVVEESFEARPETVWAAITNEEMMREWFFPNIPSFSPRVGFETQFLIQNEGRDFHHLWIVTEVHPQKMIELNWRYKDYPGDSYVTFELEQEGGGTKLTVEARVMESFPDDVPEFRRESGIAGWKYFINERLKAYLGGRLDESEPSP